MEGNTVTWNWEWVQGNLKNRDIEGNPLQPRMVDIFGTYLNKFLREIEKNKRLKERAPGQTWTGWFFGLSLFLFFLGFFFPEYIGRSKPSIKMSWRRFSSSKHSSTCHRHIVLLALGTHEWVSAGVDPVLRRLRAHAQKAQDNHAKGSAILDCDEWHKKRRMLPRGGAEGVETGSRRQAGVLRTEGSIWDLKNLLALASFRKKKKHSRQRGTHVPRLWWREHVSWASSGKGVESMRLKRGPEPDCAGPWRTGGGFGSLS